MMSLSTPARARTDTSAPPPPLPTSHLGKQHMKCVSLSGSHLRKIRDQACRSQRLIARTSQVKRALVLNRHEIGFDPLRSRRTICRTSALNARCGVAETQTLSRKSTSATVVSPPGKETLPMLDDGGSGFRNNGFTPYFRGDGSGGGSGGGGGGLPSSGEFPWGDYWFYIFLFLLRFLFLNMIGEQSYKYEDGRKKPIRRYV